MRIAIKLGLDNKLGGLYQKIILMSCFLTGVFMRNSCSGILISMRGDMVECGIGRMRHGFVFEYVPDSGYNLHSCTYP